MRLTSAIALCFLMIASGTGVHAGDPTSVDASSPELVAWASELIEFAATPSGAGTGSEALGIPDATFASLGDLDEPEINAGNAPGSITLSFGGQSIVNGAGWDFAVFENAGEFFDAPFIFAELGFVQVSTDGQSFAQFPATSLNTEPGTGTSDTDLIVPFGRDFAGVNANNVNNLAGIHPQGFGTVFDLMDLELDPLVTSGLVDLDEINFVRVVDIPGNGAFLDEAGRPILDAWLTTGTGGFDIDAVGVRNVVPEPVSHTLLLAGIGLWCGLRRHRRG